MAVSFVAMQSERNGQRLQVRADRQSVYQEDVPGQTYVSNMPRLRVHKPKPTNTIGAGMGVSSVLRRQGSCSSALRLYEDLERARIQPKHGYVYHDYCGSWGGGACFVKATTYGRK